MITEQEISAAGTFTKTHGIKGELNALLAIDAAFFEENPMFICDMEGIYVPFFIESIRLKGSEAALIMPSDVKSEEQAKPFVGKTIYVLKDRLLQYDRDDSSDFEQGAYADDLIGYDVHDISKGFLGSITGIEDSTANMLFIIRTPADKTLYIPVADPFIIDINPDSKTITTSIPEGLVELNN